MDEEDCGCSDYTDDNSSQQDEWLSDDDTQIIAEPSAAPTRQQISQQAWKVLDKAEVERLQVAAMDSVKSILGCSDSAARLLLVHFRWDADQLFGAVAERGMEYIYRLARVSPRTDETPAQPSGDTITCGCCFCDVDAEEATRMECGHAFCNDCYQQHCRVQIDEGNCKLLACMAAGCGAICNDTQVKRLIAKMPRLLKRYTDSLLESFVDDNKHVKWCPSAPHCGRAVQVNGELHCEPSCVCGLQFCFACAQAPHSPCSCEMWRLWVHKTTGDSENKTWMTANTKPCPKCQSPVEKSTGCNHVTCRCGQHFCWLCGGATGLSHTWTSIAEHTCGRYKDESDERIADAARQLKRYHHYLERWEGHVASQKLEDAQMAEIKQRIATLEDLEPASGAANPTLKDCSWLTQALQQKFLARRILSFSYVAGYYLFDGVMFKDDISPERSDVLKNLFEDAQAMLEVETERLSKLSDRIKELTDDRLAGTAADVQLGSEVDALRLDIINCTVTIDSRLIKLYDLLENDILSYISSSAQYISPYKGQSTLRSGSMMGDGGLHSMLRTEIDEEGPRSPPQKTARRSH